MVLAIAAPAISVSALASPSPSPAPAKNARLSVYAGASLIYVSQSASGPGAVFPRTLGYPYDPETPYEFFSSTPGLTGTGFQQTYRLGAAYRSGRIGMGFDAIGESVVGKNTNILYLGEPGNPMLNPFVNSRSMLFYSYLGATDPVNLQRSSINDGWIGAIDGSWNLKGGWFLPAHSLPFVFAPPPVPNAMPAIAPQIPELSPPGPAFPLQGIDATARVGRASLEFFDGALPTVYYDSTFNDFARAASIAASFSTPHGNSFSVQAARVGEGTLGGLNPITAGVMWGQGLETYVGPEGPQPESDVFGQHGTVAGVQAILHPNAETTLTAEFGRSWFSAQYISEPGKPTPGGYYHAGVSHHWSPGNGFSFDLYRFEPTYAPNILPYGNVLNDWPVAWSWPSNWLKGNYQMVANGDASVNRQGFKAAYDFARSQVSGSVYYAQFAQVTPFNATTAFLPGFTDPYFTSLQDATLSYRGIVKEYGGSVSWRLDNYAVSVDAVEDLVHRGAAPGQPSQAIDLDTPQTTLSFSRSFPSATYTVGEGRFGIFGCYALCGSNDVDVAQRVYFAGANVGVGHNSALLAEWRRYIDDGVPIAGFPLPPRYTGTRLVIEQQFRLGENFRQL